MRRLLLASLIAGISFSASANEFDNLIRAYKYSEAEKLADAKLATQANDADALIAKSQMILSYQKPERYEEAVKLVEACVAHHPKNSDCHEMFGNVYGAKALSGSMLSAMTYVGKIKDAFQKAIELNPKNLSARHSLMQFYLNAPSIAGGGKGKAKTLVDETRKQLPSIAQLLEVSYLISQDMMADAEQLVMAIKPDDDLDMKNFHATLVNSVAATHINKKNYAQAQKLYQELQTLYPARYFGAYGLGRINMEQGKAKEALSLFEKAYSFDPIPVVQFRLAQCYQSIGEKAKAINWYERALQNRPYLSKKLKQEAEDALKLVKLQS